MAWPDSDALPLTGRVIGPSLGSLVVRRAEVDGALVDVRVDDATVTAIGPPGSLGGADREIRCGGGALMPGLHDHHLHLMAMAAALNSVDVSGGLDDAIGAAHGHARPGEWIRAVGYDEAESGSLDRWRLDQLASRRPVRVQHRSGSMWVLNSAALERVGALESREAGIERDPGGHPTGRLFRLDSWLHDRLPDRGPPDLAAVGRRLASYGVTGVTDCTPATTLDHLHALAEAVNRGALPFTVAVTGGAELSETVPPEALRQGPVKIVIADHALPELRVVAEQFRRAHRVPRPVAVHCVTRAALVLALAAWHETGSIPGDRIEHAAVTPLDLAAAIADLGIAVVTQPAFLAARGAISTCVTSSRTTGMTSTGAPHFGTPGSTWGEAPMHPSDQTTPGSPLALRSIADPRSACGSESTGASSRRRPWISSWRRSIGPGARSDRSGSGDQPTSASSMFRRGRSCPIRPAATWP